MGSMSLQSFFVKGLWGCFRYLNNSHNTDTDQFRWFVTVINIACLIVAVVPFVFVVFYIYDRYEDEVDSIVRTIFPVERLSNPEFLRLLNPFKPLDKHD